MEKSKYKDICLAPYYSGNINQINIFRRKFPTSYQFASIILIGKEKSVIIKWNDNLIGEYFNVENYFSDFENNKETELTDDKLRSNILEKINKIKGSKNGTQEKRS